MGTKRVPMAPNFCVDVSGLSNKPQAPSSVATSHKLQAPSTKVQAPSHKLQAPGSRTLHKVSRSPNRGASTQDECVVRMAHMPRNLMGLKLYLVTLRDFKFNCKEMIIFRVPNASGMPGTAKFSIRFHDIVGVAFLNFCKVLPLDHGFFRSYILTATYNT